MFSARAATGAGRSQSSADEAEVRQRVDAWSGEPTNLLTEIATVVFRTSQVSREDRQPAKLLTPDHDSRPRSLRRRLGSSSPRR
jgi:hypothetical protein